MANLTGFDASTVQPQTAFDPIPPGKYPATITASEMKPTKNGTGKYLELTFQVLDGLFRGRLLWSRLNLDNPNKQAVEIARGELSAICRAVGVMTPKDSIELHNRPLVISVKCKKRSDTGEITNEINGYMAMNGSVPGAGAAPAPADTTAAASTPTPATNGSSLTPPWKRG